MCISCHNPVMVSCYNQHLPGVNHRSCKCTHTQTHTGKKYTLIHTYFNSLITAFMFYPFIICHYLFESLGKKARKAIQMHRSRHSVCLLLHITLHSLHCCFSQPTKRMCQVTLAETLMHAHRNTHTLTQTWTSTG